MILNGHTIECLVVNIYIERAIGFLGEQDKRAKEKLRGSYNTLSNADLDIFFKDFELSLRKIVNRTKDRARAIN